MLVVSDHQYGPREKLGVQLQTLVDPSYESETVEEVFASRYIVAVLELVGGDPVVSRVLTARGISEEGITLSAERADGNPSAVEGLDERVAGKIPFLDVCEKLPQGPEPLWFFAGSKEPP